MKRVWSTLLLAMLFAFMAVLPAWAEAEPSISLAEEQVMVVIQKTVQLRPTVAPYAYRKAGVRYESSDEAIATVNRSGQIKGLAEGECTVTVISKKDESVRLTVPVRVVIPVQRVKASLASASIRVGEMTEIACVYTPEEATCPGAVFTSSNEKVAVVDGDGVVTGLARGQATITVRSVDGAAKTTVKVKVIQQPTGISLSREELSLAVGKTSAIRATVLPGNADNKKLIWSSSDESVATVDAHGNVKVRSAGNALITVASAEDPSITASVNVEGVQLATSVAFEQKTYQLTLGDSLQTAVRVLPDTASVQDVTYRIKNSKIASVDENGVVTALKGGKTTLTATAADGSRHSATAGIEVIVPVTGVHFEHQGARVGAGNYMHISAVIEPSDATNKHMNWSSSDPTIASVSGNSSRVKVNGHQWGRCTLTGTTVDGGYTASIDINVGSLRRAVRVESIRIRDGKPYIVLKNQSDMDIACVTYDITGTDEHNAPIRLSTLGNTLHGSYTHPLAPGQKTTHGRFTFHDLAKYKNLQSVSIAITGWETDTGYDTNTGERMYTYEIPSEKQEWITWESDLYQESQGNP